MNFKRRPKTAVEVSNKRIPKNPKFDHIKAVVDSGASLTKHLEKINEIRTHFKYRKNEIFKRIKLQTFVQLVIACRQLSHMNVSNVHDNYDGNEQNDVEDSHKDNTCSRSNFSRMIHGIGELDMKQPENSSAVKKKSMNSEAESYLLLDVRDAEQYNDCHIKTAKNYPSCNLSKAFNYETKDLLNFKNKSDRIIIIYDDNETIANSSTHTLVERGYENVFLLSGGMKYAFKLFGEVLLTGLYCKAWLNHKKLCTDFTRSNSQVFQFSDEFSHEDLEKLQDCLTDLMTENTRPASRTSIRLHSSKSNSSNHSISSNRTYGERLKPWY